MGALLICASHAEYGIERQEDWGADEISSGADRMKFLKDLFYTRNNQALDIARSCALFSVISFWGSVFYSLFKGQEFDPLNVGTGIAAIFAGSAAWIYHRQKMESGE